jgi:hypothetical protein
MSAVAARNGLCALALVLLLAVPLAGFVAGERGPISPQAGAGLITGFVDQLKREDDETELKEIAERSPTREDREQAKEQAEQAQLEAAQAQEASQAAAG